MPADTSAGNASARAHAATRPVRSAVTITELDTSMNQYDATYDLVKDRQRDLRVIARPQVTILFAEPVTDALRRAIGRAMIRLGAWLQGDRIEMPARTQQVTA